MKKRFLSIVLVISMLVGLFGALPITATAADVVSGIYRYSLENGTINIKRCNDSESKEIIIPSVIDGYPVTRIASAAFSGCKALERITIPDSVTYIGDTAFGWLPNLEKIQIGKGVKEIGFAAFEKCDKIREIVIPNNVITIGERAFSRCSNLVSVETNNNVEIGPRAFQNCDSLVSISIPEGTTIGEEAFAWCGNLVKIDIHSNVSEIDGTSFYETGWEMNQPDGPIYINNIFYGYKGYTSNELSIRQGTIKILSLGFQPSLMEINIPQSVNKINQAAFAFCQKLTDVYYEGSEDEWKMISIGDENDWLICAKIHYNSDKVSIFPTQKTGSFQFASEFGNQKGNNGNSMANYIYDDEYFATSSMNNYNHDLSKMSLRFAMSAFAVHGNGSDKYKNQDTNAKVLLSELGFKDIENIGYSEKPTTNSIGVIAGNKKIAFEDDNYTLIAVAVRGGGYESEWGGNFNVGTGEAHKGFQLARDQVLSFLTNYVRNADISGNVKIWITGFSRAAATANLTAAYLDTHSLALNGTNTDHTKIIQVKPENIYAYCFETPAGTRATDKNDSKYNNIFSIVNQNDFVPMVAPEKWNYGRYGITYYLPTARTNSDYKTLAGNMYKCFDKYAGQDYVSWRAPVIEQFDNYKISWSLDHAYPYYGFYLKEENSKQTMDDFLQNMIDNLATTFKSPEYYNEHLEDALIFFGTEIMGQKKADKFGEVFMDELMSRLNPFKSVFESIDKLSQGEKIGLLRSTIKGTFKRMSINISDETFDGLVELISYLLNNGSLETLLGNLNILPNVHFPELCLAWLDSTPPSKYLRNTRKMCLNCPVDLEVYDSNNNLVAAIRNNEVIDIEDSSIVAYVDENGQKVVYLPTDEEYRTEIIATDDGEVTYSIQEQNDAAGVTRVINYNKMTMKKDDTLTGTAENLNETEVATYTLTSNSVTVEEPEMIEDATPVDIIPVAEGNGNVSGGGSLLKGEFAQVTAVPLENESFLGWYNDETLVSNDASYRFQVAEEITLTAKFTENTCEILYLTDDEDVVVIDRIIKGSKVTFPSMTHNPNYMILDIYTDDAYTTLADENNTYSEDAVLYAKVLTKDEWVQFDKANDKVVVYSPVAMNDIQLMMALYEEERLTGLKPNTVNLVIGKNELENLITNTGTADTLKIFVWNGLSTLKPLFKNCVVDLK